MNSTDPPSATPLSNPADAPPTKPSVIVEIHGNAVTSSMMEAPVAAPANSSAAPPGAPTVVIQIHSQTPGAPLQAAGVVPTIGALPVPPAPPVAVPAPAALATPTAKAPAGAAPVASAPPPPPSITTPAKKWKRWLIALGVLLAVVAAGLLAWQLLRPKGPGAGFVSGNGRIEATEIDVAAKLGGRVQDILVGEGDFVKTNQMLAHMQVQTLEAQRNEARARQEQSVASVATAQAQVAMRESDRQAVQALVAQRESELDAAQRRLGRSETLTRDGASSGQELDDDRARARSVQAALVAAKAQVAAAQAAITAARTQVTGARSTVAAADATIARINADIDDSALVAPRDARVQYRVAQPGEVLGAGGKVLNLVDLGEIYMTFFVPEAAAGQLALGSEARIVLDATPQYTIPAKVSFVSSTAQFTPKTVETTNERQKLMFRVKAQFDRELLRKHLPHVKTGLPGVAWVKLDAQAPWPAELAVKVPQ